MFKEFAAIYAAFHVCCLGKPGKPDSTNSNVILAGDPGVLRNVLIGEKKKKKERHKLESMPPDWGEA